MFMSKFIDFLHSFPSISLLSLMSRQGLLTPEHHMTVNGLDVTTYYYKLACVLKNYATIADHFSSHLYCTTVHDGKSAE
jgi:hypothetical protein